MENVMTNAWEIARKGQSEFGGKVKEYFAQALRMAWAIFKKGGKELDYAKQVKGGKELDYAKQVKGTIAAKLQVPKLKGSEKQIDWAKDIRKNAVAALFADEVMHEQYESVSQLPQSKPKIESRPIKAIIQALVSKEAIEAYFDKMKEDELPASRFESTVESMNNALDRYNRFMEITMNDSAKFWIDNRDNQIQNHMFKAFRDYVTHDIKKF